MNYKFLKQSIPLSSVIQFNYNEVSSIKNNLKCKLDHKFLLWGNMKFPTFKFDNSQPRQIKTLSQIDIKHISFGIGACAVSDKNNVYVWRRMEVNGSEQIEKDDIVECIKIPIPNCRGLQIQQHQLFQIDQSNDVHVYDISDLEKIPSKNQDEDKFDFAKLFSEMKDKDFESLKNQGSNPVTINDVKLKYKQKLDFKGEKIKQISAGLNHILFLSQSGLVYAMGEDTQGQCGQGRDSNDTTANSIQACMVESPRVVPRLPLITQVSAGVQHSLFLTKEGVVFGCGMNNHQELTNMSGKQGNNVMYYLPTRIKLGSLKVTKVQAGEHFSMFLADEVKQEIAKVNTRKVPMHSDETVITSLQSTGINTRGELGIDTVCHINSLSEVARLGESGHYDEVLQKRVPIHIEDVSCGRKHCLALTSAGSIFAWGDNEHGQIGDQSRLRRNKPVMTNYFSSTWNQEHQQIEKTYTKVSRIFCQNRNSSAIVQE